MPPDPPPSLADPTIGLLPIAFEVRRIPVGEVSLEVRLAGPADGPPVLLLHGFPECWWAWRQQLGPLVSAGYRVIVPSLRGYGHSDKPAGSAAYAIERLSADLVGLLDALDLPRARVVAHDWGGVLAWWLSERHPDRVTSQVILAAPHPDVFREGIWRLPQAFRSWYVFFFQLPWLPEAVLQSRLLHTLDSVLQSGTLKYPEADLQVFRANWAIPGTAAAAVQWYRALLRQPHSPPPPGPIVPPTLVLWGDADKALSIDLAEQSVAKCREGRLEVIPGVGHWLPHEAFEVVNQRILSHFGAP